MTILKIFDGADPNSCYERSESIMPQQALAMANSKMALAMARTLAARLGGKTTPPERFVEDVFELVLGRPPVKKERDLVGRFLNDQSAMLADAARLTPFDGPRSAVPDPMMRARENLVHVLMNHTDFVTIR
jgi:hypothetical protein